MSTSADAQARTQRRASKCSRTCRVTSCPRFWNSSCLTLRANAVRRRRSAEGPRHSRRWTRDRNMKARKGRPPTAKSAAAPDFSAINEGSPVPLPLSGRTVALLEARRSDDLAAMVRRLGGVPICAPAVQEQPVHDQSRDLLQRIVDRTFSAAVILTGAGVNALAAEATRFGMLDTVREALARLTLICRGPKPQAALKR